jgi:isochorismate synthase EntC
MFFNSVHLDAFLQCGTIVHHSQGQVLIGWGPRKWVEGPSGSSSAVFFFPDFFLRSSPLWFEHETQLELSTEELAALLRTRGMTPPSFDWTSPDQETFFQSFDEVQKCITEGALVKAVPYAFTKAAGKWDPSQRAHVLLQLLAYALKHPLYVYGFWDAEEGMLGGTPEILFTLKQLQQQPACALKTMALAGTRSQSDMNSLFLLQDPKESQEHHWVVQGILESLASFHGKVFIGKSQEWSFPSLVHLMTPLEFEFSQSLSFLEAVLALHPTPALGAFPKQMGQQWLASQEKKLPRGRYGAPVGFATAQGKEGCCYVAIRNVQWKGEALRVGAGCGVIGASQRDKEWQEVLKKMHSVQQILGMA